MSWTFTYDTMKAEGIIDAGIGETYGKNGRDRNTGLWEDY